MRLCARRDTCSWQFSQHIPVLYDHSRAPCHGVRRHGATRKRRRGRARMAKCECKHKLCATCGTGQERLATKPSQRAQVTVSDSVSRKQTRAPPTPHGNKCRTPLLMRPRGTPWRPARAARVRWTRGVRWAGRPTPGRTRVSAGFWLHGIFVSSRRSSSWVLRVTLRRAWRRARRRRRRAASWTSSGAART